MSCTLVWLALCWAWSESRCLTDAFAEAAGQARLLSPGPVVGACQGFMGALVTWTDSFRRLLTGRVRRRMEQIGGRFWRIDGWVPIAFDGSRSAAPRTRRNEAARCAPRYGQGATAKYRRKKSKGLRRARNQRSRPRPPEPPAWIALMWHMGLRRPWAWRPGPSNASERGHVTDMPADESFPKDTLFCGDAGFVGSPLWAAILGKSAPFLVRVGANVSLLTETADHRFEEGADGLVWRWPKAAARAGRPPLRLRLMRVRVGKAVVWRLTSVLDPTRLTLAQASRFYALRWGVEVAFRGLKQTLGRSRLRCRNAARLLAELNWSILAMAVAELFARKEQLDRAAARRTARRPTRRRAVWPRRCGRCVGAGGTPPPRPPPAATWPVGCARR